MHVQMVTQMVTFCSVDQSPIYKSDLWLFIAATPECCPWDTSDRDPGGEIFCSDMRTGLKHNIAYSFFDPEIGVLKDMIALITPDHVGMFREAYGSILKMVFRLSDNDRSAIHTLLQFYDPGLRCFVFPDYLLGPLMEEYASILGTPI
ncbi:hypothetical protein KIW84_045804 [Lathyrus oleraceus]|uniref:DUF7745 domain-containing protein n=1 Tax=Pisum sativum TaxID=3888 RepID=A0A9D4XJX9_PEA|nr:hypothetical protein KIW84_045804 [Pisum sativum]